VRIAERMKRIDAYLGTEMNLRLTRMRSEGEDVITLGVGDPDVQPSERQRQVLSDACRDANSHHYPSFDSPKPFKLAVAGWYRRRFGVELGPDAEVATLHGSADGLYHINTCLPDLEAIPAEVARQARLIWMTLHRSMSAGLLANCRRGLIFQEFTTN
jgi:aspartate/methionine/tyrosine aminotransferase